VTRLLDAIARGLPSRRHARGGLGGNPYFFLAPRPFREERLRSYLLREHRKGRPIADVLGDPYVVRCGSPSFCWSVLEDPRTLRALESDVLDAIREQRPNRRGRLRGVR